MIDSQEAIHGYDASEVQSPRDFELVGRAVYTDSAQTAILSRSIRRGIARGVMPPFIKSQLGEAQ
jgi:hypothetical protein